MDHAVAGVAGELIARWDNVLFFRVTEWSLLCPGCDAPMRCSSVCSVSRYLHIYPCCALLCSHLLLSVLLSSVAGQCGNVALWGTGQLQMPLIQIFWRKIYGLVNVAAFTVCTLLLDQKQCCTYWDAKILSLAKTPRTLAVCCSVVSSKQSWVIWSKLQFKNFKFVTRLASCEKLVFWNKVSSTQ